MRSIAALAVLFVVAAGCASPPPDPYSAYRQTRTEDVPGAFDWQVQPVAADFRAVITPNEAYAEVYGAGRQPDATALLAQVHETVGGTTGPPAWVFVTPRTCFATAKGDLVSPGRSGDGCDEQNLYVQGVDATTGETLGGFSAFMPPEGWSPARAGTPQVVTATTQLGTTRLH